LVSKQIEMGDTVNIVWFKRDLRLYDHEPLHRAAQLGRVVPLYIVEPEYWKLPDSSRRHWHFIHDCLTDLQMDFRAQGLNLIVRVGNAIDVLEDLRQTFTRINLWSHEETGNGWTYKRDRSVSAWCKSHHILWQQTPSNGVVRCLENRDVWSSIRNRRMALPSIPLPAQMGPAPSVHAQDKPAKDDALFGSDSIGNVQTGGRVEALRMLNSFLKERGQKYMTTISKPGVSARHCSRLSAHIAYGCLSVREVEQATQSRLQTLAGNPDEESRFFAKNLKAFLSRLAWRCHFVQKLEQQPEIETQCMHPAFEGMREPHFRDDYFVAWKTGQTGYPLVDASMRSLHSNGWLNFRMRAMLVSFASYHLWLDWRVTAHHLAKLFTDYEPGIHYSQFQMQSGVTGINAIRMYNPIKQSMDHDPDGKFIRRFVPELHKVSDQWIHEPWRLPEPLVHYPRPIVEHDLAIKFARAEISKRWKQDDFREEARAVIQKLGSRAKQPNRRKVATKATTQLSLDL
jgi:deoxyribodipyrimidine photo-lyase